mmetsp:Transcript_31854/g.52512  ORF Transcript_31854/g.52512 Transcript_31854/m.52512 type:complete len:233 (-) Transcript_31854:136-834(-)
MTISFRGCLPEWLTALSSEAIVELTNSITIVIRVTHLVTNAKNGHLFALEIQRRKSLVQPLVPRCHASLLVGSSIPSWRSDDEAIVLQEVVQFGFVNLDCVEPSRCFANVIGASLGCSSNRRKVQTNGCHVQRRRCALGLIRGFSNGERSSVVHHHGHCNYEESERARCHLHVIDACCMVRLMMIYCEILLKILDLRRVLITCSPQHILWRWRVPHALHASGTLLVLSFSPR